MVFVIHWHESAMDLHVFPIPIPPSTSLSTRSLWVFPVHQVQALVSCIQPGLVICMNFKWINTHKVLLTEPHTQRTYAIIRQLFQRKQSTLDKNFPPKVTLDFNLEDELKPSPSRLCLSLSFRILWKKLKKIIWEKKIIWQKINYVCRDSICLLLKHLLKML